MWCNISLSDTTLSILNYTTGMSIKDIPCKMKSEDKFWSGGKIYWCTHNLSNKDKIVFWGNPKTKEVVKIFRYILIKTTDRRKVLENFKLEYGEPKDSVAVEKEIKFVWGDSYFDKTSIPGEVMINNDRVHGLGLSLSTDICNNPLFGNDCDEFGIKVDQSYTVILLMLWDVDKYSKAMKLYQKGY